jgi:cytochrome c biogenesis protein CcmG, thiol:disulfide interchange protein DsbE
VPTIQPPRLQRPVRPVHPVPNNPGDKADPVPAAGPDASGLSTRLRSRKNLLAIVGGLGLAALVIIALTLGGTAGKRQPPVAASGFSLPELGHPGGHVSLAAYAGRPVLINFFASWCAPCKRETPLLARFYRAQHGRVLIIGIDANDQTAAALPFIRSAGLSFPVGVDPAGTVATSYGIIALPQTFMLNAAHQIVRHIDGELTPGELTTWANSLSGGKA